MRVCSGRFRRGMRMRHHRLGKDVTAANPNHSAWYVQRFRDMAAKGGGWVDYDWPHPQTKKVEAKTSYVLRFSNIDAFVGVGVYR